MFSSVMILVFRKPSRAFVVLYSHDHMAKKSAPVASVVIAVVSGVSALVMKWRQKARGRQAWLRLGGSLSLYALNCLLSRAHGTPDLSLVGLKVLPEALCHC